MLGSVTESLVDNTINWYIEQNIAYFRKSYAPSSIIRKTEENNCFVRLNGKGDIDYYGVYNGSYISFEVKETNKDHFLLSQIKSHQLEILKKIRNFSGLSFLLLNFISQTDACYLIGIDSLEQLINDNRRKITYDEASRLGKRVPISFPGILDFLSVLNG